MADVPSPNGRYAEINGLKLYYEIHGKGSPLVLLHGGGSTIRSTFGCVLPQFAETHQVIAVELQAHGHTLDIDRPLSFEQDADDVAALLESLKIEVADVLGFSNGGTTALQMAIRHPQRVKKLVLASAIFKRDGLQSGLFEGIHFATLAQLPDSLKQAYLEANPDRAGLKRMFERDVARMIAFRDIPEKQMKSITAPALVINGDSELVKVEHAVELSRILPQAHLVILPGGHGEYLGEICAPDPTSPLPPLVIALIEDFLKK